MRGELLKSYLSFRQLSLILADLEKRRKTRENWLQKVLVLLSGARPYNIANAILRITHPLKLTGLR